MLGDITSTTWAIVDRFTKWKQGRYNTGARLRLLYLECERNVALVRCINTSDTLSGVGRIPKGIPMASELDTDILEMAFLEGFEGRSFLMGIKDARIQVGETDDDSTSQTDKMNSLSGALASILVRVTLLKKLARVVKSHEDAIDYTVDIAKRLQNLQKDYVEVIKLLATLEPIEALRSRR